MTSIINDERNEFSIDFKHFQRFFIRAWPTDGQTDRTSYRGAMAHLGIILAYFWIISSDFCFFSRFSTRAWPTNRPNDRPTDRASYRGAMAHLKTERLKLLIGKKSKWAFFSISDFFLQTFAISKQIKLRFPATSHLEDFFAELSNGQGFSMVQVHS